MKYEFIKLDDDTTKLKYKEKEFEIKKTVGLLQKLQKVNFNAKTSMMKALKEHGETANDYIITRHEGNKTIEDRSNLIELENYFRGLESESIYDDIVKEVSGMSLAELMVDIGIDITSNDEMKKFMTDLTIAITSVNSSPRDEVL